MKAARCDIESRIKPLLGRRKVVSLERSDLEGSCHTARDTRVFAREIGLVPRTTPVSSPQSNGMAEGVRPNAQARHVRVNPTPNAKTVIEQLPGWPAHYNEVHPHSGLGYRSPREHIAQPARPRQAFKG